MRLAIARIGFLVGSLMLSGLAGPALPSTITSTMQYQHDRRDRVFRDRRRPVLRFEGVDAGTLTTGGTSFDLGRLVVASPSADGSSTTYNNTPFDVTFTAKAVDGVPIPQAGPVTLGGWLYGTVTGTDTSRLKALMIVNSNLDDGPYPSYVPPFRAGDLRVYLASAPYPAGGPPADGTDGSIPLRSVVYATEVVPEPSTLAIFAGLGAAVALRRLRA